MLLPLIGARIRHCNAPDIVVVGPIAGCRFCRCPGRCLPSPPPPRTTSPLLPPQASSHHQHRLSQLLEKSRDGQRAWRQRRARWRAWTASGTSLSHISSHTPASTWSWWAMHRSWEGGWKLLGQLPTCWSRQSTSAPPCCQDCQCCLSRWSPSAASWAASWHGSCHPLRAPFPTGTP